MNGTLADSLVGDVYRLDAIVLVRWRIWRIVLTSSLIWDIDLVVEEVIGQVVDKVVAGSFTRSLVAKCGIGLPLVGRVFFLWS